MGMNRVIVAYAASATSQVEFTVTLPAGATVQAAIEASGVLTQFPEINLPQCEVGVFSQRRQLGDVVKAGDRVEIYRPLLIDPKEARRAKAAGI